MAKRFKFYNPHADLSQHEETGLLPCNKSYEYGTPNLERNENIAFIASSSTLKQCLVVSVKWRPNKARQTVTTISKLTFILEGQVHEFAQVETYKPSESHLRPGTITQYGSGASKLKVSIQSPYSRSRISFNGPMRRHDGTMVFLKLSCVLNPFTQVYDFLDQWDDDCLKKIYANKKPVRTYKQMLSDLVLHDRHEQRVRLDGDYILVSNETGQPPTRQQEQFCLRGHYARHFLTDANEKNISTSRFYAIMSNGQGFQICTRKFDSDEIDLGYTAFEVRPKAAFVDKPYTLNCKLDSTMNEFQLQISGQGCTFDCHGGREVSNLFRVVMNGKPGWAWLSLDDELVESDEESEAMERSRDEQELGTESGAMCGSVELDPSVRPLVVSIGENRCAASDLVGSKASSLAQLLKFAKSAKKDSSSYRVPFAFVLTRFAHDQILEECPNLQDAINQLQQFVGNSGREQLELRLRDECKKLEELVSKTNLPKSIAEELWTKLTGHYESDQLQGGRLTFAVRSSSWGEDEDDMSAAGQLSTMLSVKPNLEDLSKAIMACFASKFSSENVEYKRQHGQPLNLPMAVVVQEMVSCDKAGVMFTCDPTTGDESLITITANYGLGESVVSAQADPDSIRVRVALTARDYSLTVSGQKNQLEIDQVSVGQKNVVITNDANAEDNQNYDKSKCCLNDDEILRLARCGLAVKRYFWSQRRDIEWGYLGGELYLFQSRPVTGLDTYTMNELIHEADRPCPAEVAYFTRANIGEVMPYPMTPLTLTYGVHQWDIVAFRLSAKFQPNDLFYAPEVSSDVFVECYHSFFSVLCSIFLSLSEDDRSVMAKSMEISFFGREMGPQPEVVEASKGFIKPPNPFAGTRFDLLTLPLKWMPLRTILKEKHVLGGLRQEVRELKLATGYESNKLLGLYNQMRLVTGKTNACWENHILILMFAGNHNMILTTLLSKYIKDPMQLFAALNKFLAISPDVVSAEIPERIRKMAKLVQAKGQKEMEKFTTMPSDEALEYLLSDQPANSALKGAYEDFMRNLGHRSYNEFELAHLAWREEPKQIVDMIQKNCSALSATGPKGENQQQSRPKTIDEVIKSLNVHMSLKDRLMVKHVLAPKCQLMLSLREKTKDILVMLNDIVRECTRMMGQELQRQLRIPDADLIYYLMYQEVEPLVRDYQPTIVMQAIRRRQMFKRMFSELWKFDEIFSGVIPNHMKPSKELDEAIAQAPRLTGTPASSGKVQGRVCLVNGYKELDKVKAGTILVTHSTDIAFSPVFPLISGIITEVGGLISHGAVVAREYGLPSVIGIPDVTMILQDGEEIILDADNGAIIRLSKSPAQ